jgi:diguanylate cyclase (GGDEF)-like protein/PAS domain S-box-containing protein
LTTPQSIARPDRGNRKDKILIVEDESIVADTISMQLEQMDYDTVSSVSTGEEAIAQAGQHQPALALINIKLPGKVDGIEAARQINSSFDIPVIFLTTDADEATLKRAKNAETFGYILKPFSALELHSSITMAIGRHRAEQKLRKSEARFAESQRVAHIGSWEYHTREDRLWWSDETYSIFGLSPDEDGITIDRFLERIHKDDRAIIEDQVRSGLPYRLDYRIIRPDGLMRHIHEEVRMSKDENGVPDILWGTAQDISDLKSTEKALRESEERYRLLIENQNDLIIKYTPDRRILYVNPQYCRIFGKSERYLKSSKTIPHLHKEDSDKLMKAISLVLAKDTHTTYYEDESETGEGPRWFGWSSRAVLDDKNRIREIISVGRDITTRKSAEEKAKKSQKTLINVLDGIEAVVYAADMKTHKVLYLNKYTKKLFGNLSGKICWETLQQGQTGPCNFCTNDKLLTPEGKAAGVYHWEFRNTVNGRWYSIHDRAIEWVDGRIVRLEIATDITDLKEAENMLRSMSFMDDLTGLHNRRGFLTLADQQLKTAHREKSGMLLIFADLDRMKWINDNHGHPAGDKALTDVSRVLQKTFRESDIIARIGGDEFVVVTEESPEINIESITGRLQSQLDAHNMKKEEPFDLSLSLGIVRYDPGNPRPLDEMLTAADTLMYKHKREKSRDT